MKWNSMKNVIGYQFWDYIITILLKTYLTLTKNNNFNFNFILPKVNTDYIRQSQVLNIDNLIIYLQSFNEIIK